MDSNRLYLIDVDSSVDENSFTAWYDKMPAERKARIDAFKVDSAKRLCLGAGILLHTAMADLGIGNYSIGAAEHGKPYLISPGHEDIFFNISHSGSVAVLALSDREVGVDIEALRHFKKTLVEYAFNKEEIELAKEIGSGKNTVAISHSDSIDVCDESDIDLDPAFTRLWTFKESVMKYTGMGISLGAKNIHLSAEWPVGGLPEADSTSGQFTIRASCDAFDLTGISFTEYSVPGYALTVCSEYADFSEKIQIENY